MGGILRLRPLAAALRMTVVKRSIRGPQRGRPHRLLGYDAALKPALPQRIWQRTRRRRRTAMGRDSSTRARVRSRHRSE